MKGDTAGFQYVYVYGWFFVSAVAVLRPLHATMFRCFFFDVLLHQHFHVIYLTRMDSLTSVLDIDVLKDITGECTQVRLTERYGCANV